MQKKEALTSFFPSFFRSLQQQDLNLSAKLSQFTCRNAKCPYKVDNQHPVGCRDDKNYNAAAIPQFLAEEVADYVNAKFCLDQIRCSKEGD